MSDIEKDIKDLIHLLRKLYKIGLEADAIVFGVSMVIVFATGGLTDLIVAVLISTAFGIIPFPFNFLTIWTVDPWSIVAQTILFFVLVIVFRGGLSD
jgi:hypothetical protein